MDKKQKTKNPLEYFLDKIEPVPFELEPEPIKLDKRDIVRMWEEGISAKIIAEKYNITKQHLWVIISQLRKSGIKIRKRNDLDFLENNNGPKHTRMSGCQD